MYGQACTEIAQISKITRLYVTRIIVEIIEMKAKISLLVYPLWANLANILGSLKSSSEFFHNILQKKWLKEANFFGPPITYW